MADQTKFSPEVRERAVRLVQEHRGESPSSRAAVGSIAPKIGCTPTTLLAERLGEAGINPTVGNTGGACVNALAETICGPVTPTVCNRLGVLREMFNLTEALEPRNPGPGKC
ncbi:hypothetical protein CDEN61S_03138 [Castellaniella denitrificans]